MHAKYKPSRFLNRFLLRQGRPDKASKVLMGTKARLVNGPKPVASQAQGRNYFVGSKASLPLVGREATPLATTVKTQPRPIATHLASIRSKALPFVTKTALFSNWFRVVELRPLTPQTNAQACSARSQKSLDALQTRSPKRIPATERPCLKSMADYLLLPCSGE